MNLDFCAQDDTADERMVRDAVRSVLDKSWKPNADAALQLREMRALWSTAARQGWTALDLSVDALSGLGAGRILAEETGRADCPLPVIDALLANAALQGSYDLVARHMQEALQAGELCPTWGWEADEGAGLRMVAHKGTVRYSGQIPHVEHAGLATHLFVPLGSDGGIAVVSLDAAGVTLHATPGLARPNLSEIRLDGVESVLTLTSRVRPVRLIAAARWLLAARALGATAHGLALLVDYAKVRTQFGQKIGQYQAIQHKLANCLIGVEVCRLCVQRAARDGSAHAAAVASANAAGLLRQVVLELHHGFGGVSFWEEHAMPRIFRRVHADLVRLGGVYAARRDLAAAMLDAPAGTCLPDLDLGEQVNAFRLEVRRWVRKNWDHRYEEQTQGQPLNHRKAMQSFSRKLGEKGWLGLSWPTEFGGLGLGALEQLAFEEEMAYAEAPVTFHNIAANMIGPALVRFGSEEQRRHFLGGIARGEIAIALGYSEPDHGSDLAGIRTAARRAPQGGWVIRGQKTFTSTAGFATHLWLAARTDPAQARHRGISVFLLPMDTAGISMQPMIGLNGHRANTVFLDDVWVPDEAMVGGEGEGWQVISAALAYERATLAGIAARARGYFDRLLDHIRAARMHGVPMASDSLVRERIGALIADIEGARLLALQTATVVTREQIPVHEAAISKVFSSELMERISETAFDLLGVGATIESGNPTSLVDGCFEYAVRDALLYTIGGGTNEIQRTLIAIRGLDLPR